MKNYVYVIRGVPPDISPYDYYQRSLFWEGNKPEIFRCQQTLITQHTDKDEDAPLLTGPLSLRIDFTFPPPAKGRRTRVTHPPMTKRPDLKTLIIFLMEIGVGTVYHSINQIVDLHCTKAYHAQPSTTLTFSPAVIV